MDETDVERMGVVASLVATVTVGVATLLRERLVGPGLFGVPPWMWWTCYAIFSVLVHAGRLIETQRAARWWLAALCCSAVMVFLLAPEWSFTAICLVVSASSAPFVLGMRATLAVVAGQTVVIPIGLGVAGSRLTDVVLSTAIFAGFQLFAAMMAISAQREGRARAELAEVNRELRAAQVLLRESAMAGERLRISRELHDLVGHQLTALALELEVASHHATGNTAEQVGKARQLAKDLLTDLRIAVSRLRTTPTELSAALTEVVSGIQRLRVHLEVADGLEIADPVQANALVRCVQEVVTNTVRHAAADNLWIEVDRAGVRCRDDGRGAAGVRPGNGLTGMRERFEQLGGGLAYHTEPGQGFRLHATLPTA